MIQSCGIRKRHNFPNCDIVEVSVDGLDKDTKSARWNGTGVDQMDVAWARFIPAFTALTDPSVTLEGTCCVPARGSVVEVVRIPDRDVALVDKVRGGRVVGVEDLEVCGEGVVECEEGVEPGARLGESEG